MHTLPLHRFRGSAQPATSSRSGRDLRRVQPGHDAAKQVEPSGSRARRNRVALAFSATLAAGLTGLSSHSAAAQATDPSGGQMPIFMASQDAPSVKSALKSVEGLGCEPQRDYPRDVQVQREDALTQLRQHAAEAGANGLVNVRFETIHTDRRNACWQGVMARGDAVVLSYRAGN